MRSGEVGLVRYQPERPLKKSRTIEYRDAVFTTYAQQMESET